LKEILFPEELSAEGKRKTTQAISLSFEPLSISNLKNSPSSSLEGESKEGESRKIWVGLRSAWLFLI
jgi:hypothetical protein